MVAGDAANLCACLACKYGGLQNWDRLSKNRYKHIHVRFSQAVPGLRDFWKACPNSADLAESQSPQFKEAIDVGRVSEA